MGRSLQAQLSELGASLGVPDVELRRSSRRRRSISAFREQGRLVISAPARIGAEELLESARWLLTRVLSKERAGESDEQLAERAAHLASRFLPATLPVVASIRWTESRTSWGSCTSADATIRISRALLGMPQWVIDYVIIHELIHLLEPNHDDGFYALGGRYPRWDEARAFLDGVIWQSQHNAATPPLSSAEQMDLFTDAASPAGT